MSEITIMLQDGKVVDVTGLPQNFGFAVIEFNKADLIRKDGVTTITSDEKVVPGDTPWQANDPCCRGINSSDYRW